MLKEEVSNAIAKHLKIDKFNLLTPKRSSFGDYAINKNQIEGLSPPAGGWKLVIRHLLKESIFKTIEEAGGFVNLFLSHRFLAEEMNKILEQKDKYGASDFGKKRRYLFEFGQPNTHKTPHIGHLFSYIYGEACSRLLEFVNHKVFRANYQGDVGLHVAKCLYKVKRKKEKGKSLDLEDKVSFLQKCYQEGAKAYEEDEKAKKEIEQLNMMIYKNDPSVAKIWRQTRNWSLDYYKKFEERLGIKYDKYYFESQVAPLGLEIAKNNLGKIFKKSEGAIIFDGKRYGLHKRVFINRAGLATYEAKDLGLAFKKYQDWPFDLAIITTASEQNEYWKVVKKAIELVLPHLEGKILHIGFGMINLKTGKMSSRRGEFISAFQLVEKVKEKVKKAHSVSDKIAEKVALSAIKYSFLKSDKIKDISFDIDQSISLSGNSGPYILYTYARARSVLNKFKRKKEKGKSLNQKSKESTIEQFSNLAMEKEELSLLRTFFRFPEVVEEAAKNYSPHLIANFLFDLCQKFNLFYEKWPILKAEGQRRDFRLSLTEATSQLLKTGLNLLGIRALERI